jgi:signal peptidase I
VITDGSGSSSTSSLIISGLAALRAATWCVLVPAGHDQVYTKALIGVPGDVVKIEAGQVFVNQRPLEENYIPEDYRDRVSWEEHRVPADEYFVLGDHRSSSSDSRTWGFVKRGAIYGKAVFVYWPLEKMGRIH